MLTTRVEFYSQDSEPLIAEKDKELSLKKLDEKLKVASQRFSEEVKKQSYKLVSLGMPKEPQELQGVEKPHEAMVAMRKQLAQIKKEVMAIDLYIYSHATQFSSLTFEKTKRQAKNDALKAYDLLHDVMTKEGVRIDPDNKEFFKIHNTAFRNFVICLVTGIAAILAGIALFAGMFVLIAYPMLIPDPNTFSGILVGMTLAVSALITGGVGLIMCASEFYSNYRERNTFIHNSTKTLYNFFHQNPVELLTKGQNTAKEALSTSDSPEMELVEVEGAPRQEM